MGNVERNPGPAARSENLFSKLIQGHFSQGHEKFGEFAGLKCVLQLLFMQLLSHV